jgi:hypothetical protein
MVDLSTEFFSELAETAVSRHSFPSELAENARTAAEILSEFS